MIVVGGGAAMRALAARLGLECAESAAEVVTPLMLLVDRGRLVVRSRGSPRLRGVAVDFSAIDIRTGSGGLSKKQPLAKAVGREVRTVVDATAGLGHDAFLLACLGWQVTAIERSPIVAALLEDGLSRAAAEPRLARAMGGRLTLRTGDARELLAAMKDRPDVIYMDPMFPPKRKKSALAKIEVRLLRELVGDDDDAAQLMAIALNTATNRVVVKRPIDAEPLGGEPTICFKGKLVRYDVYRVGLVDKRNREHG